jgi:sterol desaturase/sphingolipid hydroxylase (fatty acid hydroxylase superfamily)
MALIGAGKYEKPFSDVASNILETMVLIMKSKILLFVALLIFIIPQPVSAYLDPGFASMVWQMMAAMVFVVAFTIKIYWQKIKGFFSRSKTKKEQE